MAVAAQEMEERPVHTVKGDYIPPFMPVFKPVPTPIPMLRSSGLIAFVNYKRERDFISVHLSNLR